MTMDNLSLGSLVLNMLLLLAIGAAWLDTVRASAPPNPALVRQTKGRWLFLLALSVASATVWVVAIVMSMIGHDWYVLPGTPLHPFLLTLSLACVLGVMRLVRNGHVF